MTACAEPRTLATSPAVQVRWELWESLVSMVRVYANAASLSHGEFAVTVLLDAAWVQHRAQLLSLRLHAADGSVELTRKGPEGLESRRSFPLLESGMLVIDGKETELDRAAIDWIEELTSAAARQHAC